MTAPAIGRARRTAELLSRFHHAFGYPIAWVMTGFVILNLLLCYYSPHISIPVRGPMGHRFQIYRFVNGYTETNSDYYSAYIDRDLSGAQTLVMPFPIYERFRLDFLGNGAVLFPGKLFTVTRTALRQVTTTYRFDPTLLGMHGFRRKNAESFYFFEDDDPYIDIPLRSLPLESVTTTYSICPILYVIGPILFTLFLHKIHRELAAHRFLVLAAVCVCVFLSFVAFTLPYNHGPDEEVHILSGDWYLTHLFPPSMASPIFYDKYWGWNYVVDGPDLTYWMTFKLAHCIQMLFLTDLYKVARIAQIALFAGIFLVVLRFSHAYVAWAYLLSAVLVPQIAYSLTYVNGDVLSYFLSVAALGLLLAPRNIDIRIAIAVSLFILCNTKTNYLVLLAVALYILYRQYGLKYWPWVAAGLAMGSYRRLFTLIDEYHVGRNLLQNELIHCSAAVQDRLLSGHLEFRTIIRPDFYLTSLQSLYAKFGFMTFSFPWYFYLLGVSLAILLILATDRRGRVLILVVFVINLAMTEYFSMSMDYQPQGRYLFPTVALLMLMSVRGSRVLKYLWYAIPTAIAISSFWLQHLGAA